MTGSGDFTAIEVGAAVNSVPRVKGYMLNRASQLSCADTPQTQCCVANPATPTAPPLSDVHPRLDKGGPNLPKVEQWTAVRTRSTEA